MPDIITERGRLRRALEGDAAESKAIGLRVVILRVNVSRVEVQVP